MVLGILFLAVIVALFAVAFSFILAVARPAMSLRRRVLAASLGAGIIPSIPAFFAIGYDVVGPAERMVALSATGVFALLMAGLVGFPVAHVFSSRAGRGRANIADQGKLAE